ncbi:hypothetical protein PIB30_028105 [Stylosanthes scabra]|uniref:Uncharacterized protein n=1 Tax=Stylosanthes scabra TaxID=79078 RepID=A0ABU6TBL7_9FABA|nr:hypothetical protein [Stylosanthes scabra]
MKNFVEKYNINEVCIFQADTSMIKPSINQDENKESHTHVYESKVQSSDIIAISDSYDKSVDAETTSLNMKENDNWIVVPTQNFHEDYEMSSTKMRKVDKEN